MTSRFAGVLILVGVVLHGGRLVAQPGGKSKRADAKQQTSKFEVPAEWAFVGTIDKVAPDGTLQIVRDPKARAGKPVEDRTLALVVKNPAFQLRLVSTEVLTVNADGSARIRLGRIASRDVAPQDRISLMPRADGVLEALKQLPEIVESKFGRIETDFGVPVWLGPFSRSANQLHNLGLALLNYVDSNRGFYPPAVLNGPDGKPWHSWRVLLLPFIDEKDLYESYRWDEPWDGPNNRLLLSRMPNAYRDPSFGLNKEFFTHYVAITGKGMAFPPEGTRFDGKRLPESLREGSTAFKSIADGLDKTLVIGTVGPDRKIPWMKPEDIVVGETIPRLGEPGSFALMPYQTFDGRVSPFLDADGGIRALCESVDPKSLHALLTIRGKEAVAWNTIAYLSNKTTHDLALDNPRDVKLTLQIDRNGNNVTATLLIPEQPKNDPPPAPPQQTIKPLRTLKGHQAPVWCVAFAADGRTIVSGSGEIKERVDDSLRVWDAASGAELRKFGGHKGRVLSVACSAQGTDVVSADQEGRLCHWNAADARLTREWSPRGWHCARFSADNRRVLVGGQSFLGWQNLTGNDPPRKFALGGGLVWSLAVDETNKRALSAGGLVNTFRLWDSDRGTEIKVFEGHTGVVEGVAFTPDGKHAVSSSHDGSVRLWEVATGRQVRRFRGHERPVFCVAVSPDGSRIASGGSDTTVRVWDIETGNELIRGEGHGGDVRAVAFSPDGRTLASGSVDWTVRQWAIFDR